MSVKRDIPSEGDTDPAWYGAGAWIVACLAACAFLAVAGGGAATPPSGLPGWLGQQLSEAWFIAWPVAAVAIGLTAAPVVAGARGRAVAIAYAIGTGAALVGVPIAWLALG